MTIILLRMIKRLTQVYARLGALVPTCFGASTGTSTGFVTIGVLVACSCAGGESRGHQADADPDGVEAEKGENPEAFDEEAHGVERRRRDRRGHDDVLVRREVVA